MIGVSIGEGRMKEVREVRNALKWGGISGIVVGVAILIGAAWLYGALYGIAAVPDSDMKRMAELATFLIAFIGVGFVANGVADVYYASKLSRALEKIRHKPT